MRFAQRFLLVWVLLALMLALPGPSQRAAASPARQEDPSVQKARALLAQLTPEERVGQLFLVTFQGSTFDEESQIFSLIANYNVGGVVLQRANDNFSTPENIPAQANTLNRLLQDAKWNSAQRVVQRPGVAQGYQPKYIPLLIGLSQEGDDYPNDQLLNGLTPLPNAMAIGATWSPELAQQVGVVMGKELSALGFNLYFGPSLDVLDTPRPDGGEDLATRSFGGSAYWVGKMGQAYISGLHQGSAGRLMVIAKHFPGLGGSDRSPDDEIATVRKPLEQLTRVDLAPFFDVTTADGDRSTAADGLLVSHVRYQGFQGAIRSTTRPVSFDASAMEQILKLQPVNQWRGQGGVLISDNLGSQAVRRFYDPQGSSFDARTVAREAFVAGNDMLYVDRFIASGDPDTYTTLTRTMDYFAQKYREDAVFAQRVDASVERILALKYRLYPDFLINRVTAPETGLADVGLAQPVAFDVARRAVTMISPDAADFTNILPRGPEPRDRIVFLTDVQTSRQCSGCAEETIMAVDALQAAVLRLYGPRAGGQISQNLLTSYGFSDLAKYLNEATTTAAADQTNPIEDDLLMADWVVVSMVKPDSSQPDTQAFKRLLTERPGLLRNKSVIVFAFGAPYYLDATDISKLTAYYGMYSKTAPFIEVAARILFQDLFAVDAGALPVSVPGVGYDLSHVTSPDPNQVIPLFIDSGVEEIPPVGTIEPTPVPMFRVGDVLPLRTGVIYDRNRNPVPDGTVVRFLYSVISESTGTTLTQTDTETKDGVARAMYRIDRPGLLEIHAASEGEVLSNLVRLDITTGVSAGVTVVAPTPQPTQTLAPTPTITPTREPTMTPTPIPPADVKFQDWFLALLMSLSGAAVVAWLGIRWAIARWGLRWALCGLIGGLIFYLYLAMGLPGSEALIRDAGTPGILLITLTGIVFGWGVGLVWRQRTGSRLGRMSGERGTGERSATGPKSQSG